MNASTARRGSSSVKPSRARQFGLHVEGQALLGAADEVVQLHAHVPQEGFGLLEDLVFVAGEDVVVHQIGGVVDVIEIFADPVERLQIAQAPLALLDVGLDQIAAFALARVALVAFGELGFDEIRAGAGGDLPRISCAVPHRARNRPTDSALPATRCGW